MGLRNVLIVAEDIEKAKEFYHDLFGLNVVRDFGENVILSEGLVLQERKTWERLINASAVVGNASELFFEVCSFDAFVQKVREKQATVVAEPTENSWGRRVIRLKDPDGHLIEVAER